MPGDFFAEDYNVLLFVIVLGGLSFMITGCFIYHKWQHKKSKSKDQFFVPQKTRSKLRNFLRRGSGLGASISRERALDAKAMQEQADEMQNAENDSPVVTKFSPENRNQSSAAELEYNISTLTSVEPSAVLSHEVSTSTFYNPQLHYDVPDVTEF